jgi:hypothetical protein
MQEQVNALEHALQQQAVDHAAQHEETVSSLGESIQQSRRWMEFISDAIGTVRSILAQHGEKMSSTTGVGDFRALLGAECFSKLEAGIRAMLQCAASTAQENVVPESNSHDETLILQSLHRIVHNTFLMYEELDPLRTLLELNESIEDQKEKLQVRSMVNL